MSHTFGTSTTAHVEGRTLHVMVRGAADATTTVVFESGLGMSRSSWGAVVPAVAGQARTVVYDRAGTGRSPVDPTPRTLARLVDDLVAVVDHVGAGRVVLVGHSWGGAIVRAAVAALGADRVAGVVVVDQVDERCELYFDASSAKRFAMSTRMVPTMARLGLYRLLGSRPGRRQPADVAADHRREDFSRSAAAALVAEMEPFLDELASLREDPPDLGGVPLVVITGTKVTRMDRAVRGAITTAHRRTAAEVPHARLVEATGSAHLVMFTEPEVVVGAVVGLAVP